MPARPRIMPPVGKSGPGTISISSAIVERRVVDQRDGGVDHLAEVVRRDVGRHADGDAAGAVDQQVREARRQHHRLLLGAVVVVAEIDRILVDVLGQRVGDLGAAAPRCSASPPAGRRRPSRSCPARRSAAGAWRSPAPCGRARRRSTGRRADGTCPSTSPTISARLAVGLVPVAAVLVHRIEDAAMDRLQPVAHVRQGARDDHAHGVIEIALPHLVGDRDGGEIRFAVGTFRALSAASDRTNRVPSRIRGKL